MVDAVQSRSPFSVLKDTTFRALWLNTFAFILIQSVQRFAYVWLVLELGGSEREAGVITFAMGIPVLFVSLPAGVLSDRMDRRKLLFLSQFGAFVITAITAAFILSDNISIPLAYVLAAAMGVTTAYGQPVRQAIVPSIVPTDRLQNAIALSSLAMNTSFMLGPALGGLLIKGWGMGQTFGVLTLVFVFAMIPLRSLRLPPVVPRTEERHLGREIREGLSFIVHTPGIRVLVVMLVIFGLLMIGPFGALLPVVARDQLGRDAAETGALFATLGVGMLITSLILAAMRNMKRRGLIFAVNYIAGGVGFALIGWSRNYVLTAIVLFFWGMGGGLFINLNQMLIQMNTPPNLMGRVMSVHTLAFVGIGPIGALIAGGAAEVLGPGRWIVGCGIFIAATAVFILLTQPSIRRLN